MREGYDPMERGGAGGGGGGGGGGGVSASTISFAIWNIVHGVKVLGFALLHQIFLENL